MQSDSSEPCHPAAALFGSHLQFLQNSKAVPQNDAWPLIHWSVQAWGRGCNQVEVSGRVKIHGAEKMQDFKISQMESVANCQSVKLFLCIHCCAKPFLYIIAFNFPLTL